LHIHCFLPKREAQKLVFAHFNNLKQNFRWRPQFTDQRQQISHLFTMFTPSTSRDRLPSFAPVISQMKGVKCPTERECFRVKFPPMHD
jgi:hypothetical protein